MDQKKEVAGNSELLTVKVSSNKNLASQKTALRKEILENLKKMKPSERQAQSQEIFSKLLKTDVFRKARKVSCYISKEGEVETAAIIDYLLAQKKEVCVPVINQNSMMMIQIDQNTIWKKSAYGLKEPTTIKLVNPKSLDLIIVPGIGFSLDGCRLGRGKGYYDQFLKSLRAYKLGLAFEHQIHTKIPLSDHDIKLDGIITPKTIAIPKREIIN